MIGESLRIGEPVIGIVGRCPSKVVRKAELRVIIYFSCLWISILSTKCPMILELRWKSPYYLGL